MEALRKKLKCRRGASILMALLFMLVCIMVGSSLLMAAAANAGKFRSNREEQQKYLIVSSALTQLCGEITGVEYAGRYTYEQAETWERITIGYKEDGTPIEDVRLVDTSHTYIQQPGMLRVSSSETEIIEGVRLFLRDGMDNIFAQNFQVPENLRRPAGAGHQYTFDYDYANFLPPLLKENPPYAWEFEAAVKDIEALEDKAIPDGSYFKVVKINAVLDEDGRITLTATLGRDPADPEYYSMEAVLKPALEPDNAELSDLLVPDKDLAHRSLPLYLSGNTSSMPKMSGSKPALSMVGLATIFSSTPLPQFAPPSGSAVKPTETITWELEYVRKGAGGI